MLKWFFRLALVKKAYDWYTSRKNKPKGIDKM